MSRTTGKTSQSFCKGCRSSLCQAGPSSHPCTCSCHYPAWKEPALSEEQALWDAVRDALAEHAFSPVHATRDVIRAIQPFLDRARRDK